MKFSQKIAPCLWFAGEAEEAARFYTGIFPDSKIVKIARYGKAGFETHRQPEGTVLNGGPLFKFTEAISLQVYVDDQKELDFYWDRLTSGGDPKSQVCGWLKDKYGLSWQVVPAKFVDWFGEPNEKTERLMTALLQMGKLDIAALERAYQGR